MIWFAVSTGATTANQIIAHRPFYMFLSGRPNFRFRMRRSQDTSVTRTVSVRVIQVNAANNTATGITGPVRTFTLPPYSATPGAWVDVTYGYEGEFPADHINNPQQYYRIEFRSVEAWGVNDGICID